jgi:subtilisin family serine protease
MPRPRRLAVLLTVAVVLAAAPAAATSDQPARPAGAAGSVGSRPVTVTLLTGDKVTMREAGGRTGVTVRQARRPRGPVVFQTASLGGDLYVVPSDVQRLVGKALDPELFNVSQLVRMRYDDARTADLPLIVQRTGTARPPVLASAGLRPVRELGSLRATAVRQPRRVAARLGAALDPNLTQIGAPAAWSAGLTGRGVRVAVLDTGVDSTHPDLQGKVVAQANFSDSAVVTDRDGHGTHVASIVAGTGARAAGARQGVAFGASLLNAKVLDDFGFGSESGIIAGMEWAATQRAKVANMSLGGWPTDGTDPLSQAVDRLTASKRVLFVVSAGNFGPGEQTVESPGAANSALTVGAVDAADELADFSARGPRFGDHAMKPDITAPGVDIVAARAAGTSLGEPVDQWYTRLSGTSMAAPHVAGAAAVLAQRWPDWSPTRLKAVLMGTADPNPELGVYQQGGGRLDVAHAIAQRVIVRRVNLDFGFHRYPQTGTRRVAKPVLVANLGDQPATVDLTVELRDPEGDPAPAGMAVVSPRQVTLAPGAEATAYVTVDPRKGPLGAFSGALVATPGAGPVSRTPLGLYKEPEHYDLTIRTVGRDGQPGTYGSVGLLNVDDGTRFADFLSLEAEPLTVRVPPGRYNVVGSVYQYDEDDFDLVAAALVGDPQVEVREATSVVLDARRARPVSVEVEGVATSPAYLELGYTRTDEPDRFHLEYGMGFSGGGFDRVFAEPMGPASAGQFEPSARWRLMDAAAPDLGHSPFLYDLVFYGPAIPDPPAWRVTPADHGRLARVVNHFKTMNDAADYQELRFGFAPLQEFGFLSPEPVAAPRARVEYLSPDPVRWGQEVFRFSSDGEVYVDLYELPYAPYDAGERQDRTWYGAPFRPDFGAQRDLTTMWAGFNDLHDSDGHSGFLSSWSALPVDERIRLFRNGQLLADVASSYVDQVEVGQAEARYRLERDFDASAVLSMASPARSVWEFTSAGTGEPGDFQDLPLLEIDYRAAPLGGRNGAVAGQPVTVDLDVHRREGTPASEVVATNLSFSTDGGTKWIRVALTQLGPGRYRAVLPGGAMVSGRTVSLRALARDAGDGRLEQTLLRAFPIR